MGTITRGDTTAWTKMAAGANERGPAAAFRGGRGLDMAWPSVYDLRRKRYTGRRPPPGSKPFKEDKRLVTFAVTAAKRLEAGLF